ncbi:hypothetical protein J6590_041585 [Homalodisca vitripennis]|nr:hypothetical protein J6590_041585 [Homalodisca vitripennis]
MAQRDAVYRKARRTGDAVAIDQYRRLRNRFIAIEEGVRNTRTGSSTLRIPQHRTTDFNKSFVVSACRLWNSLPDTLKYLESRDRFASAVKLYFLQRMSAAVVPEDR